MEDKKTFSYEDLARPKQWNQKVHTVDMVLHTPHGTVSMIAQKMTDDQLNEFRGSMRSKLSNPHGHLELSVLDGLVIVPHELLVTSVIQIGIDAKHEEEKPPEEKQLELIPKEE